MGEAVYINQLNQRGDSAVVDFSPQLTDLAQPNPGLGAALFSTIEQLGLQVPQGRQPELHGRLRVEGAPEGVREGMSLLGQSVEWIARQAAQDRRLSGRPDAANILNTALHTLALEQLPALPESASLMRIVGVVVQPFVHAAHPEGVTTYHGRYAGPRDRTVVTDESGQPLGRFSVRDIGGLLIGPNGLPAENTHTARFRISRTHLVGLTAIAAREGTGVSEQIRNSLRHLLDNSKPGLEIPASQVIGDAVGVVCLIPRRDMERMVQTVTAPPDGTFGNVFRTAIASFIEPEGDRSQSSLAA